MDRYNKFWVTVAGLAAWIAALAFNVDPQVAGSVILTITAAGVVAIPNRQ